MINLYSKDYLSGRVWYPKDLKSKLLLHHLIQKDRVTDTDALDTLAELHDIEVCYV